MKTFFTAIITLYVIFLFGGTEFIEGISYPFSLSVNRDEWTYVRHENKPGGEFIYALTTNPPSLPFAALCLRAYKSDMTSFYQLREKILKEQSPFGETKELLAQSITHVNGQTLKSIRTLATIPGQDYQIIADTYFHMGNGYIIEVTFSALNDDIVLYDETLFPETLNGLIITH